jgi:hypothetical protein
MDDGVRAFRGPNHVAPDHGVAAHELDVARPASPARGGSGRVAGEAPHGPAAGQQRLGHGAAHPTRGAEDQGGARTVRVLHGHDVAFWRDKADAEG